VVKHIINAALLIAADTTPGGDWAGEPRPEIPPELVLERFNVAKGGDCLLVPVRIGGKDRQFVVDTNTLKPSTRLSTAGASPEPFPHAGW
jgi:hypothetical protein